MGCRSQAGRQGERRRQGCGPAVCAWRQHMWRDGMLQTQAYAVLAPARVCEVHEGQSLPAARLVVQHDLRATVAAAGGCWCSVWCSLGTGTRLEAAACEADAAAAAAAAPSSWREEGRCCCACRFAAAGRLLPAPADAAAAAPSSVAAAALRLAPCLAAACCCAALLAVLLLIDASARRHSLPASGQHHGCTHRLTFGSSIRLGRPRIKQGYSAWRYR